MLTVLPRPPLHSLHRRLRPPGSYSADRRRTPSNSTTPAAPHQSARPTHRRTSCTSISPPTSSSASSLCTARGRARTARWVSISPRGRPTNWATASSSATRGQQLLVGGGTLQRREADAVVVLHNLRRLAGERIEGAYQCGDGLQASALCGGYLTTRVGAVAFRNTKSVVDGRWSSVVPRVVLRLISAGRADPTDAARPRFAYQISNPPEAARKSRNSATFSALNG
jgi:hypothetical protein